MNRGWTHSRPYPIAAASWPHRTQSWLYTEERANELVNKFTRTLLCSLKNLVDSRWGLTNVIKMLLTDLPPVTKAIFPSSLHVYAMEKTNIHGGLACNRRLFLFLNVLVHCQVISGSQIQARVWICHVTQFKFHNQLLRHSEPGHAWRSWVVRIVGRVDRKNGAVGYSVFCTHSTTEACVGG